ncbi:pyridoxamine 5'-phosphate oxidase family protein [Halegenticoccus tardaugens]|uniref:pyridoxamine 5'-phosphate oxidase family protein n=1 Tax=Halegenticoccus tardaugens TaxID=2071624 RepID=UPI00100A58D4|nr:pyridoxamine 5'-phosphate oxidase family protein [Halegenticoccus tardaugens]
MVEPTGVWSRAELDAFLDDAAIPLRLACRTPADDLWTLSLWYRYRDGAFWCATSRDADVVRFLRANADVAFEVSTNRPPYRGVRGRGTTSIEPDEGKKLLRGLLERYLGGTESSLAASLLSPEREEAKIRIEPTKLYTWDFSERMADVAVGDGGNRDVR